MKTFQQFLEETLIAYDNAIPHTVHKNGKKTKLKKGTAIAVGRSSAHGGGSDGSGGDSGDGE